MIYIRIKPRIMAMVGERLTLGDVADLLADARLNLHEMQVSLPLGLGIWQIDALQLIVQIQEQTPNEVINLLGDGMGWLHRETKKSRQLGQKGGHGRWLRRAALCFVLSIGIALMIGLFHIGGGVPSAQADVSGGPTRQGLTHMLLLILPYVFGICLGIVLYLKLIARKATSPLTVKLREYRDDMEKASKRSGKRLL